LGHLKPDHQELAMDSRCAPQWVFPAHPLDKIPQAAIDLWPPYPVSGLTTPEHFEASAMPPQDGLRLNYLSHGQQARPEPGHGDEQGTVTAAKSKTRWSLPQSNGELMTEKQILSFKPGRDLNRSATNIPSACGIANIALNDATILPYDANPSRMEFSERTGGNLFLQFTTLFPRYSYSEKRAKTL
jgi:hypothetical protein